LIISIVDVSGKTIYIESINNKIDNTITEIDISGLSKGVYFIKIRNSDTKIVEKLIVN